MYTSNLTTSNSEDQENGRKTNTLINFQNPNMIKFTTSVIQYKIIRHTKKQRNMAHNKEKYQLVKSTCQLILLCPDQYIKRVITTVLHMFKLCKHIKILKVNQRELFKIKFIWEMKQYT